MCYSVFKLQLAVGKNFLGEQACAMQILMNNSRQYVDGSPSKRMWRYLKQRLPNGPETQGRCWWSAWFSILCTKAKMQEVGRGRYLCWQRWKQTEPSKSVHSRAMGERIQLKFNWIFLQLLATMSTTPIQDPLWFLKALILPSNLPKVLLHPGYCKNCRDFVFNLIAPTSQVHKEVPHPNEAFLVCAEDLCHSEL